MVIKKIQFFVIYINYGFTLNAITSVMLIVSIACNDPWCYLNCNSELYALDNLSKQNFVQFIKGKSYTLPVKTQTG